MAGEKEILSIRDLSKHFGGVRAVDGVSLKIFEGDRISIIGPNGAGKTTLINLISGYLRPTRGSIIYYGRDITALNPIDRINIGIVRSFQLVNLFNNLTVFENILIPILSRRRAISRFISIAYKDREAMDEAEETLRIFGLSDKADRYPTDLSQGDRKLLDIALTFALKPRLIMLDEPTSGVSTRDKHLIMEKIVEILQRAGITSMIIEHDMDIVFKYSQRIIVMHQGRVIADGKPDEIRFRDDIKSLLIGGIYA